MALNTNKDWLESLDSQIEYASPEFLKAALEHSSKMLDHIYSANDAISHKARWAIGVIMGVMVVLLRQTIEDAKFTSSGHPPFMVWVLYGILLAILTINLILFISITWVEGHQHSGIEPRLVSWREIIEDALACSDSNQVTDRTHGIDFAYFVSATLPEYQRRIDQQRVINEKIAFRFNFGVILLVISLAWWMISYVWLNS